MGTKKNWEAVQAEHIREACERYDRGAGPRSAARSTFLIVEGKAYPAKFIRGSAHELATGVRLDPSRDFSGGQETARHLRGLGFQVDYQPEKGASRKTTSARRRRHTQVHGVTICVQGQHQGNSRSMPGRIALVKACAAEIKLKGWSGIDCVVLPGGYFFLAGSFVRMSFEVRKRTIEGAEFSREMREACSVLGAESPGVVWTAGVDSRARTQTDQLCVAWNESGVAGLGRKVFPTHFEGVEDGFECNEDDHSSAERVILLPSGRTAVLCACYDMFGCAESPERQTKRTECIRRIFSGGAVDEFGEPGFAELRGRCVARWAEMLQGCKVSVALAAIHHFERPGRDVLWQRHGISTCSAALGGGLALGAAHFDRLPKAAQSPLAAVAQATSILDMGPRRGGTGMAPVDGFEVCGEALVRLYRW